MSYPTTPLPRGPILIPGCCTDMPQTYFSLSLFTHIIFKLCTSFTRSLPFLLFSLPLLFYPSYSPLPCSSTLSCSVLHLPLLLYSTPTLSLCQTQDFHLKDIKQMLLGEWRPRLGSRLTSIPSLAVVFTPLFCCPNLFHVHKLWLILYLCVPCHVFDVYLPLCFFLSR